MLKKFNQVNPNKIFSKKNYSNIQIGGKKMKTNFVGKILLSLIILFGQANLISAQADELICRCKTINEGSKPIYQTHRFAVVEPVPEPATAVTCVTVDGACSVATNGRECGKEGDVTCYCRNTASGCLCRNDTANRACQP